MARYKDVEGYRKLFDEEYKKTRKLISEGETHLDNLAEGFSEASRVIDRLPTADVVPKSEVERLESELDDFTVASLAECKVCGEKTSKVIADLQEKLSNAKAEVAREIFAEIDNILYKFAYPSLTAIGKINVINAEGYHLHTRDYAELKKKYTEGEHDS